MESGDSYTEVMERFDVSRGWVAKVMKQYRATGVVDRPVGARPGRKPKVTAEMENAILAQVAERSDSTLAEVQLELFRNKHPLVSISCLWRAMKRLGLRRKKNPSRQRT